MNEKNQGDSSITYIVNTIWDRHIKARIFNNLL
jgi:hypothetical protein